MQGGFATPHEVHTEHVGLRGVQTRPEFENQNQRPVRGRGGATDQRVGRDAAADLRGGGGAAEEEELVARSVVSIHSCVDEVNDEQRMEGDQP